MEHLEFEFNAGSGSSAVRQPYSIAGVVASGNLEVMIEPKNLNGKCRFIIDTAAENFGPSWEAVISDFMERRKPADLLFSINDNAASPAVVSLRIEQAYELLTGDEV